MHDDESLPQSEAPPLEPLVNGGRTSHPPMLGNDPKIHSILNAIADEFIPQEPHRDGLPTTIITHPQRVVCLDVGIQPHKDVFQKS